MLYEVITLTCELQPHLSEMDFGAWDGVPFDDLESDWPRLEQFWHRPFDVPPPGGETLAAFHQRITQAWQRVITSYSIHYTKLYDKQQEAIASRYQGPTVGP